MSEQKLLVRPVVFDYGSPSLFLRDLLRHYKATKNFSLRQRAKSVKGCSQSLVSQIIAQKRILSRDHLPALTAIFKLTSIEADFIDELLKKNIGQTNLAEPSSVGVPEKRKPQNHLLSNWLNAYVKDLVNLNGFTPTSAKLYEMLFGIATQVQIERSIKFLFREGFWKTSLDKKVIVNDPVVTTTNELPNEKIREFHRKALQIALRGLNAFPVTRRKASTVLISVNEEKLIELRQMIDSFQKQLLEFIEKNHTGKDQLVQVTIHLTPVGGPNENDV